MKLCPNQHPNEADARFCTVCGVAIGGEAPPAASPPIPPAAPFAPPRGYPKAQGNQVFDPYSPVPQKRPTKNIALISSLGVAVLVIVGGLVWAVGIGSGPQMAVDEPRTLLMKSYDFPFDMEDDDDFGTFLDRKYPFFGSECRATDQLEGLLSGARAVTEESFDSGESLIQYVSFHQVLLRLPSNSDATEIVERVTEGARSDSCAFKGDTITDSSYGVTTISEVFGYDVADTLVFNSDTVYDAVDVLEATVRGLIVVIAQDNYVLVIDASFDSTSSGINNRDLRSAVDRAVQKAYGDY